MHVEIIFKAWKLSQIICSLNHFQRSFRNFQSLFHRFGKFLIDLLVIVRRWEEQEKYPLFQANFLESTNFFGLFVPERSYPWKQAIVFTLEKIFFVTHHHWGRSASVERFRLVFTSIQLIFQNFTIKSTVFERSVKCGISESILVPSKGFCSRDVFQGRQRWKRSAAKAKTSPSSFKIKG